jgi:hypothetical protein
MQVLKYNAKMGPAKKTKGNRNSWTIAPKYKYPKKTKYKITPIKLPIALP